jgi:hypothetical protein
MEKAFSYIMNEQLEMGNLQVWVWLGANSFSPQNPACYEMLQRASDLDRFFGMNKGTENKHEVWNFKCQVPL